MLAREPSDLRRLGLRNFERVDAAHADAFAVHVQHDLTRGKGAVMEELHQDEHDEFLRGVVVVVQEHFVKARPLDFGFVERREIALLNVFLVWLGHGFPFQCVTTADDGKGWTRVLRQVNQKGESSALFAMKKTKILVLFDTDADPPADQDYTKQIESADEAEFDVARALIGLGHDVRLLGFKRDLDQLVAGLKANPVDVVFNLSEGFRGVSALDYSVAGILEMLGMPYTGATPEGLMLARDKALTKMVLAYHGLRIPHFMVRACGEKIDRPSDIRFPLIVKPLDEDASVGIAQASVVHDDQALAFRVAFIHQKFDTDAIVEEFIVGREIYVGVMGNDPPRALPPIEMVFGEGTSEESRIATFKVKWSMEHRLARGITNRIAKDLPKELQERLADAAVRAYRAAGLRDYGRIDVRLAHDDEIYLVEANPNPYLADGEDLAWAAEEGGHLYPQFIEKIVEMAITRAKNKKSSAS